MNSRRDERHAHRTSTRVHMSDAEVTSVRDVAQVSEPKMKPCGLWYGVGRAWLDWCDTEMPHWKKPVLSEVIIRESSVLFLKTKGDVLDFDAEFGVDLHGVRGMHVAWADVAKRYGGVEIAPYHWGLRDDLLWYYSWDVLSGCVWRASAVTGVRRISESDVIG